LVLTNTTLTAETFGDDEEAAVVAALVALAYPADPQFSSVLNVVAQTSAFETRRRNLAASRALGFASAASGGRALASADPGALVVTVRLGALWDLRGRTDASRSNFTSAAAVCAALADDSALAADLATGGGAVVAALRAAAAAYALPALAAVSVNASASSPPRVDSCAQPHVPLPTPMPSYFPTPVPSPAPSPPPSDAPTPVPTLVPSLAPTPSPSDSPTPVPTLPPSDAPTPVPSDSPTPLPTLAPTPSPTGVLRGYKDCFCLSAQWVADLNTYCPSVAANFAEGCDNSLTVATMKSYFGACPALKSGFFTEGWEREK
jgi:hypothetical protein